MTDLERDWKRWPANVPMGKLAHYCRDWDFLPVDEHSPEFECCLCFTREERAQREAGGET